LRRIRLASEAADSVFARSSAALMPFCSFPWCRRRRAACGGCPCGGRWNVPSADGTRTAGRKLASLASGAAFVSPKRLPRTADERLWASARGRGGAAGGELRPPFQATCCFAGRAPTAGSHSVCMAPCHAETLAHVRAIKGCARPVLGDR
jgi:hypothetical protein